MYEHYMLKISFVCSDRWTCSTTGSEPICKRDPGVHYPLEVFSKEGIWSQ